MSDDFYLTTPVIREGGGRDSVGDCLLDFFFGKKGSEETVLLEKTAAHLALKTDGRWNDLGTRNHGN